MLVMLELPYHTLSSHTTVVFQYYSVPVAVQNTVLKVLPILLQNLAICFLEQTASTNSVLKP